MKPNEHYLHQHKNQLNTKNMKDFLFGKLNTYLILTDNGEYKIGGRKYTYRGGILTVKDCFTKVATFVKIKHITEI